MKKFAIACAAAASLVFVSAPSPASAQAVIVRSEFSLDDNTVIPAQNLCGIEYDLIRTQGNFRFIEMVDGNGGSHFKAHGEDTLTYKNPTTGAIYVADGIQSTSINPNVTSFLFKRKLVVPGPGNNYTLTLSNKIVINGNGEMVVDRSEFAVDCR
jgi:hypothetical protein